MYRKSKIKIEKSIFTKETQHGFDLSVKSIFKLSKSDGKMTRVNKIENFFPLKRGNQYIFILNEKMGFIPLEENVTLNLSFIHRSSLNRMGGWIDITQINENNEFVLFVDVTNDIKIEKNARICQVVGEEVIVSNSVAIPSPMERISLNVTGVEVCNGGVISENTTIINEYKKLHHNNILEFNLKKGNTYIFTTDKGCDIKSNQLGKIFKFDGNLLINSPIFDAGFKTDICKIMVMCYQDTIIKKGDYICDLELFESEIPSQLYNGQFQNK